MTTDTAQPEAGSGSGTGGPAGSTVDRAEPGNRSELGELKSETLGERAEEISSYPGGLGGVSRDALASLGVEPGRPRDTGPLLVGEVQGDQVTTKNVYMNAEPAAAARVEVLPLTPERIEVVREAYVRHSEYAELVTLLKAGRRVLVIQTRASQGGSTAGIRLMLDLGARRVFELAPGTDLRELSTQELAQDSGYLLDTNRGSGTRLNKFDLERLEKTLGKHQSWFVVTVDPEVRLEEDVRLLFAGTLGTPPPAVDIVAAHLQYWLGSPGRSTADALLQDAQVAELVTGWLVGNSHPQRAAELARLLYDTTRDPDYSIDKVRERIGRLSTEGFEKWFDNTIDLSVRCLVIALAVLHGFPYETVADAAQALEGHLVPQAPEETPTERRDPFASRRSLRVEAALARLVRIVEPARYGSAPVDVVRFLNPSWPQQILERVWTEYDDVRPALLDWLGDLIRHPWQRVRVFAATAVGYLSYLSFPYVASRILEPWANSDDVYEREAAAAAVTVPARDSGLTEQVSRMLRAWQREDATANRHYTVARTLGGPLGQLDPARALTTLGMLAAVADRRTRYAIRDSIAELVTEGDDTVRDGVLAALRDWIERDDRTATGPGDTLRTRTRAELLDRAKSLRFTAFFAFLGLCHNVRLRRLAEASDDAVAWPGVLWLAGTSDSRRELIALLWHRSLDSALSHEAAQDVLDRWGRLLNRDPDGGAVLAGVLVACARFSDRTLRTIRRRAQLWAVPETGNAPQTAAVVTAALDKAGLR